MNWKKYRIAVIAIAAFTIGCDRDKDQETQQDSEVALEMEAAEQRQTFQAPSNYAHLKELGWLVGDWKDDDQEINFSTSWKWDKHKNFLTQQFTVSEGEEIFEGKQLVAWDSIKKKIRSWIFDSDGGFGEGYWSKDGDSWYVNMTFTLPDGRKTSAVNVFSKIDDRSYSFSSVSRDVDGTVLPDIGPFKVIKKS